MLNWAGIEWSAQFCCDPARVEALRQDAEAITAAFPHTIPELENLGYKGKDLLSTAIPDAGRASTGGCGPLALLTRTAPARASAAHIAIVGHITAAELAAHTHHLQAANGFLNRFCFVACRRHRLLPHGGDADPLAGTGMEKRLGAHLATARHAGQVHLDPTARVEWHDIYAQLSQTTDGLVGSICARAEAHALPLAMLHALVDGDTIMGHEQVPGRFVLARRRRMRTPG